MMVAINRWGYSFVMVNINEWDMLEMVGMATYGIGSYISAGHDVVAGGYPLEEEDDR